MGRDQVRHGDGAAAQPGRDARAAEYEGDLIQPNPQGVPRRSAEGQRMSADAIHPASGGKGAGRGKVTTPSPELGQRSKIRSPNKNNKRMRKTTPIRTTKKHYGMTNMES